mmetsp:Transcript_4260/g.12405  ORF Transcript_4260/g.12405 Transcript_4260/m.12405 type:complete len:218 (+) Transcript_4260:192-845(+)
MPIVYSLVARGTTVLANHSDMSGNFPQVATMLLANDRIPTEGLVTFSLDPYAYHVLVDQGITFMCMTTETGEFRMPNAYLNDISHRFLEDYAFQAQVAIAYSLNTEFAMEMRDRMHFFNNDPNADQLAGARVKLDTVKNVMTENIDTLFERGEKIELLVEKTYEINNQAQIFRRQTQTLKCVIVKKYIKQWVLAFFLIFVVVYFIMAIACGLALNKC